MENFDFYNPVRVIFGPGSVQWVGREARTLGRRAFIVSYKEHAFFADLLAGIGAQLEAAGLQVTTFYEVAANPTMDQVVRGIAACRTAGSDLVIAIGGGSAMDAAKIIAAGVLYPDDPWRMIVSRHDQVKAVFPTEALPLLMVPTLPATSSEMNCTAVVTHEGFKEKSYVYANCLYPRVSILDPALTCTLPPYQTACGAADAISHALETYLNGVPETPLQDAMLEGVIHVTMEYVQKALANPADVAARAQLQWAAAIAWNGWCSAGAGGWAPMHQWGHVLSARYNVTHGASLAIIMPAYLRHLCPVRAERYARFAERVMGVDAQGRPALAVAEEGIERLEKFLRSIGVPTRLADVGVGEAAIDELTDDVVRISFGPDGFLASNPPLDRAGVRQVYALASIPYDEPALAGA